MNILVVDDDPIVLASCRRVLEPEGYAVSAASSAAEAISALKERECQLLLLDVKMPEHDGFYLLGHVRKSWPRLPVVVMSGFPTSETMSASAEGGAISFIPKPFTPDELLQTVRRAVRPLPSEEGRE
jgi:DNA-binding NtrC family response regulator